MSTYIYDTLSTLCIHSPHYVLNKSYLASRFYPVLISSVVHSTLACPQFSRPTVVRGRKRRSLFVLTLLCPQQLSHTYQDASVAWFADWLSRSAAAASPSKSSFLRYALTRTNNQECKMAETAEPFSGVASHHTEYSRVPESSWPASLSRFLARSLILSLIHPLTLHLLHSSLHFNRSLLRFPLSSLASSILFPDFQLAYVASIFRVDPLSIG